jgi:hypothetical protein
MIPFGIVGAVGMLAVTLFLLAINNLLVPQLQTFSAAVNGLDFNMLATAFLAMALIFPAIAIIAYATVYAGVLALIASFLVFGVIRFIDKLAQPDGLLASLTLFASNVGGLDFGATAKAFGAMALIFAATAVMAYITIPAGIIGAVASFFVGGVLMFINALNGKDGKEGVIDGLATMSGKINGIPSGVDGKLETLGSMFGVLAKAANLSFALIVFTLPFIKTIMNKALDKINPFANKVLDNIIPPLKRLGEADMGPDPASLATKVDTIGKMMAVIATLAGVAVQLMEADTESMPTGSQVDGKLGTAESFMTALFTNVQGIIGVLTGTPLTAQQIASAAAIGNVLGAIGDMVKAVAPSPELIKSLRTESSSWGGLSKSTKTDTAAIAALADYMDSMMGAIADQIPKIMGAIMDAVKQIPSSGGTGKKIKLVAEGFKVISVLAGAISDIMGAVPKQKNPKKQAEMLKSVIDAVNDALFGDGGGNIGGLKKAFDGLKQVINSVPSSAAFAKKIPLVATAFGVLGSFADSLGKIMKLMPKEVEGSKEFGPRLKALIDPGGLMDGIVGALSGDSGALARIFETLKTATDQLPGDEAGLKAMMTKVEILGAMFGVVGTFASAMSDIAGMVPNVEGQPPPPLEGAIDFAKKVVDGLVGADSGGGMIGQLATGLIGIVEGEGTKDLYKYRRQIKALGATFEVIGKFASALGDLGNLSTGEGAGASGITTMLGTLEQAFGKGKAGNLSILGVIGGFAEIGKEMKGARLDTRSMEKGAKFAEALANTMNSMSNLPTQISADVDSVTAKMAEINSIFTAAGEGGELAIAVAVAQGLQGSNTLTIQHENMAITMNVNITMGADDIARGTIKALGSVNGQPGYKVFAAHGGEGG